MVEKYQRIGFRLSISPDEYKRYYRGKIKYVVTMAHDGRHIKFPASALRRFVTPEGIQGEFEIEFGQNNRLKGIRRIK